MLSRMGFKRSMTSLLTLLTAIIPSYSGLVDRLLDNDAVVAAVATQPGAVGYTSLSALKHARGKARVVVLRENPQAAPVLPTPETIRTGAYPVIRKLHFYTAGKPSGTVKSFINACQDMGKHGLVEREGRMEEIEFQIKWPTELA